MDLPVLDQPVAMPTPMIQRLRVPQFHRMMETGILQEGEAIELIDGLLIRQDRSDRGGDPMVHGPRHAFAITRLQTLGLRFHGLGCHLRSQLPVTISEFLEPEPDAAVVRGLPEDYRDRHPGPADTIVVVEVADSSLEYDRTAKQRIYARAGIAHYWIVSIPERRIEVYSRPAPAEGRYLERNDFQAGETIRLEVAPGRQAEVAVAEVLL